MKVRGKELKKRVEEQVDTQSVTSEAWQLSDLVSQFARVTDRNGPEEGLEVLPEVGRKLAEVLRSMGKDRKADQIEKLLQ